jgi:beta-lactamase regulating signal transducer with metallopeptidase domain
MASLMSYCVVVAVLMSLAAVVVERLLTIRGRAHRIVWVVALSVSLSYPALRILTPPQLSSPVAPKPIVAAQPATVADTIAPLNSGENANRTATPIHPPAHVQPRRHFAWPDLANWNSALKWLWIATSVAVLIFYLLGWIRLRLVARRWPIQQIDGTSVRVAEHVGPAVIGFLKPQIVLPRWLLGGPTNQRAMVLAHESEHIAGNDPRLVHMALLFVALAPWNLPLWWQLRRLRFSIEVDCDRRVLKRGTDAKDYGEMLLSIGQRRGGAIVGVLALTEKTSQLERRIRVITGAVRRQSRLAFIALIGVSISAIVAATVIDAPKLDLAPPLRYPLAGDLSPLAQRARAASKVQFPELFEKKIDGFAVVAVVFNNDGSLFTAVQKEIPRAALSETIKEFDSNIPAGAESNDFVLGRVVDDAPIDAWADSKNPYRIVLVAKVLRWPVDPTRSLAKVKEAVLVYFPDLLQAPDYSNIVITVFMNDDGTVKRGEKRVFPPGSGYSEDMSPQYADLGVAPEDIGRSSQIMAWRPTESEKHTVNLRFAWPKRADDRPEDPNHWWWVKSPYVSSHETPEDRAIVARYFPGVLENGVRDGMGLWVLVARDGTILKTGQSFRGNPRFADPRPNSHMFLRENTGTFVEWELEARYPGIKVYGCNQGWVYKQVSAQTGQKIPLDYECLSIQSPITDLRTVETANRADIFIGGRALDLLAGSSKHNVPFSLSMKFDELATGNLIVSVQATATDAGPGEVELKLRLLSSRWWTSEWSDWSAPTRVAYDQETTVEVPNKDSGTTHLVLRPIRLNTTD